MGLRGSPEAIGRGVAVGVFVAFSPTMGFQIALALGVATLVNANRPVAVVPTFITNPVTLVPIYGFTHALGSLIWPGPSAASVARSIGGIAREFANLDPLAFSEQLALFIDLGTDVLMALTIGGAIVGGICAAVAYPLTVQAVVRLRAQRARRKNRRRRKRKPKRKRRGR